MGGLPLLLLGGAALLIMSKKKAATSASPDETEEASEEEIDYGGLDGSSPASNTVPFGDTVVKGTRLDRLGPQTWRITLGEDGEYVAWHHAIGHRGPKDEIGRGATVSDAKKILSDYYNATLVAAGYPNYQKEDPWFRPGRKGSSSLTYRR